MDFWLKWYYAQFSLQKFGCNCYIFQNRSNAPVSIYLFSFSCYRFVEKIFKIKLNTHVTKYTDIIIFKFSHTIYPQWCIMPLFQFQLSNIRSKSHIYSFQGFELMIISCLAFTIKTAQSLPMFTISCQYSLTVKC